MFRLLGCIAICAFLNIAIIGVADSQQIDVNAVKQAAKAGHIEARFELGVLYAAGEGVPKDAKRSYNLIKPLANKGYAPAQYVIGWMCETGFYVQKNMGEAAKWYRRATEQGLPAITI